MNGNLASAVSSGGILLKHPGRVGHASFFGCGNIGCKFFIINYKLLSINSLQ